MEGRTRVDYINRWRTLSLECKDRLSETSAVEMFTQGMPWDLLYVLQMTNPEPFKSWRPRHMIEITIANRRGCSFGAAESKNNRAKFKKNVKFSTSSTKEAMTISKVGPVWTSGEPNPEQKRSVPFKHMIRRHPALKELQEKRYPFLDSNFAGMPQDLLEKGVIQLPEPKRPEDVGRTADLKYCHYHRMVSHPLKNCVTLKSTSCGLWKMGR